MTPDTFPSLFWSYTAVWAVFAIYIATLGMRIARVEKQLGQQQGSSCERTTCGN